MAAPQQEIGMAMWGGLRPEDAGERRELLSATPEDEDHPDVSALRPVLRTLASIFLAVFGLVALLTGLGLLLGWGGVLIGAGIVALTIGLLLGMGES